VGGRIELHAHTHFSDGTLSPADLVALATTRALTALAITDHDSVAGVAPAMTAADALRAARTEDGAAPPEIVAGIEISSALEGNDVHVLGYFVDWRSEALASRLERFREERRARARAILNRLAVLGVPVAEEEVFASAVRGWSAGRTSRMRCCERGYVPTIDVAFQRYLGTHGSAFVPRPTFHSAEAVRVIREAGGAAVVAHTRPRSPRASSSSSPRRASPGSRSGTRSTAPRPSAAGGSWHARSTSSRAVARTSTARIAAWGWGRCPCPSARSPSCEPEHIRRLVDAPVRASLSFPGFPDPPP
jgi:predicted metal-dependent phosphoesterase TrpH